MNDWNYTFTRSDAQRNACHPQSRLWHHHDGDRCATCGALIVPGPDRPPEPVTLYLFDSYVAACERTRGPFNQKYFASKLLEELAELIPSWGHPVELLEELGDAFYSLAMTASIAGLSLRHLSGGYYNMDTYRARIVHPSDALLASLSAAGRIHSAVSKTFDHGAPERDIRCDLAGCLCSFASLVTRHGMTLSQVASANINKLFRRYPLGYTREAAVARADKS